jgi:hypothetical protein
MKGADERAAAAARAAAACADGYERLVSRPTAAIAAVSVAAHAQDGVPVAVASEPELAASAAKLRRRRPRHGSRTLPRQRLRPVPRLHRA